MRLAMGCSAVVAPLSGQRIDTVSQAAVAQGITHNQLLIREGPWRVNVVAIDLRQPGLSVRAAHADDKLRGFETVSSIARRKTSDSAVVVVAINADFFSLTTGEDQNNQVIEGEIFKGLQITDAPPDSAHRVHSQFAVGGDGRPFIGQFTFHGTVIRTSGARIPLDAINYRATRSSVVLYTARDGATTPWDSAGTTVDIRLRFVAQHSDTSVYQVTSFPAEGGTSDLQSGPVLSWPIGNPDLPRPGETIRIQTNLRPAPLGLRTVIGGRPRLVVHGRSVADSAVQTEGTMTQAFLGRNPRTGIGFSRDSATLYLITVDGRQPSSDGMSLAEFADFMIRIGVFEGLNLDGGGSTAMVVNGVLVNTPSDKDKAGHFVERAVGNALLVVKARHD